jgi:hypothetical protein
MTRSTFALVALLVAAPAFAQTPAPARPATPAPNAAAQNANQAQLRLIVIDQTSAGIPTATVTLTPSEGEPVTVITDERGVVTVPSLPVGTFKIHIEFSGFDTYEGTLNIRRGANNQTVTMALAGLTQEVVVNSDEQAGGDTRGAAMTTTLSKEEIAALPDTQEDLQTFLEELAGPGGATFFLNGFRGGRLPTKDEIRTIRIRSNSFAADGHDSGGRTGIEIITRPSTGSYQGGMTFGYQGDKLSARNPQAMEETPEGTKQIQLQFRGPVVRNKTSFSLNVSGNNQYRSIAQIALDQSGNPLGTQVRVPTETRNVSGNIEHALTAGSTLRLAYQGTQSEGSNQGLTSFDYTERARQTESTGNMYRAQVQGLVGQGMLNEIRFEFNRRRNETTSYSNAPAVIVPDAFSSGGAGVFTRNLNQTFEIADNFDFTPIKNHQMRVGLLIEGGLYDFFDETNPNGRTTYASFNDFQIDRKLQFTQHRRPDQSDAARRFFPESQRHANLDSWRIRQVLRLVRSESPRSDIAPRREGASRSVDDFRVPTGRVRETDPRRERQSDPGGCQPGTVGFGPEQPHSGSTGSRVALRAPVFARRGSPAAAGPEPAGHLSALERQESAARHRHQHAGAR